MDKNGWKMAVMAQAAQAAMQSVQEGFARVHLSGNLMDTMAVETATSGETGKANGVALSIPAEKYDLDRFYDDGVVVYTGDGSYANEVDATGGFSGAHIGYVGMAVNAAVEAVLRAYPGKAEVVENG